MAPSIEPILRMLRPTEAAAFWALRLRSLREHPEAFASSVEEEENLPLDVIRARLEGQSPGTNLVLGVFVNDRLGGMVGIRRDTFLKEAHKARLWGMYVIPELQGRGLGKRLLEVALDAGRRMGGIEQVQLSVVVGNTRARSLFQSLGFESYGVEKRALRIGDRYFDEEFMSLALSRG